MKVIFFVLLVAFLGFTAPVAAEENTRFDFSLTDIDGNTHRLNELAGKWVIINFWATWCTPCITELPELVEYQTAHPEQKVLAINFEQIDEKSLRAFIESKHLNFPVIKVGDKPLVPIEPLKGLPTTAIISPKGEILANHTGPVTADMLETFIKDNSN